MTKSCSRCHKPKVLGEFVRSTVTKTGYGSHCLQCDRERVGKYRSDPQVKVRCREYSLGYRESNLEACQERDLERMRIKQQWLNSLKQGPCVDCGKSFPPCCMDFDHTQGSKFKGIGKLLSYSKERILTELEKCELVCAVCHRVRTEKQRGTTRNPRRVEYHRKVALLKDTPCVDCGKNFPPVAMDFDHVQGGKVSTIARMRSVTWPSVLEELLKCELVCANCHRIRTYLRVQTTL